MHGRTLVAAAAAVALSIPAWPQGPAFQTPGLPPSATQTAPDSGQADRFASVFNPAFSFIVDAALDYVDFDQSADGWDASLRVLELTGQSWVDPHAWAYFVAAADEEELTVEEAAVHYTGLGGHSTLRGGRFFVDFGKQMQIHVHELRTLERPVVLRAYLGEEVKGDGLQVDHWFSVGDATAVRWSVGAFADLLPEELDFPTAPLEQEVAERKSLGDFNFTARVSGFTDVGESGTFQVGASLRAIPDYSVTDDVNGLTAQELDNEVYGADLTYGWVDETGEKRFTIGGEALLNGGDTGFDLVDPDATPGTGDETLTVLDESVFGYYGFVDYAWDRFNSAGVQYSSAEIPDAGRSDVAEIELYYSHLFSELHRVRLVAASIEDDTSEDALRVAVQYTAAVGAHGHGINW